MNHSSVSSSHPVCEWLKGTFAKFCDQEPCVQYLTSNHPFRLGFSSFTLLVFHQQPDVVQPPLLLFSHWLEKPQTYTKPRLWESSKCPLSLPFAHTFAALCIPIGRLFHHKCFLNHLTGKLTCCVNSAEKLQSRLLVCCFCCWFCFCQIPMCTSFFYSENFWISFTVFQKATLNKNKVTENS